MSDNAENKSLEELIVLLAPEDRKELEEIAIKMLDRREKIVKAAMELNEAIEKWEEYFDESIDKSDIHKYIADCRKAWIERFYRGRFPNRDVFFAGQSALDEVERVLKKIEAQVKRLPRISWK